MEKTGFNQQRDESCSSEGGVGTQRLLLARGRKVVYKVEDGKDVFSLETEVRHIRRLGSGDHRHDVRCRAKVDTLIADLVCYLDNERKCRPNEFRKSPMSNKKSNAAIW